jgi:acetoin utilization protein AcuB
MLVKEHMTKNPLVLAPDMDVTVAFSKITDRNVRQAPVVEDGKLRGIVTDRDLRMALVQSNTQPGLQVRSIMTEDPVTVSENSYLREAARLISKNKFNALPVLSDSGELIGVLTTTDILNGLVKALDNMKEL